MKTFIISTIIVLLFPCIGNSQSIKWNGLDTFGIEKLPPINPDLLTANKPKPPQIVVASDGEFPKVVRVTWKPVGDGYYYKVYRSETKTGKNRKVIKDKWVRGNLLIDNNSVIPGKYYYYWIIAALDETSKSGFSIADRGHAKKEKPIASPLVFDLDSISINFYRPPSKIKKATPFSIRLNTQNKDKLESEPIMVKFFISQEKLFNADSAIFLDQMNIEAIPPLSFYRNVIELVINDIQMNEEYYLHLVVNSMVDENKIQTKSLLLKAAN